MRKPAAFARGFAAGLAAVACAGAAAGERVACRYTYGGETRTLTAAPVASPYAVPSITVGSYFRFRVVFVREPADLAAIKVYAYADRDDGPVLIHEADWPYPPPQAAGARYGFSGLQSVYEPVRDGELQYWCALQDDAGDAR